MSPQRKKTLVNIGAILSALLAVGGWAIRSSASALDARYVHVDSFAVYQAGETLRHAEEAATLNRVLDVLCEDRPAARACK
jgi:hypothetical protein